MGLPEVSGGFKGLQGVTGGEKGFPRGFKGVKGVTGVKRGYRGVKSYKLLPKVTEVTSDYRELQGGYKGLH